jgi:hypothetical protein
MPRPEAGRTSGRPLDGYSAAARLPPAAAAACSVADDPVGHPPVLLLGARQRKSSRRRAPRDRMCTPSAEIAKDWHASHWGTRLLVLRDPDGQAVILQHGETEA